MLSQQTGAADGAPGDPVDALETAVGRMARIGWCDGPSFAPDGVRLACVADLSGVPQVWTMPAAGGWPELVTPLDDPVGTVAWSPDGAWLAFTLAPGGGMNTQVYLVRPDGRDLHRVTAGGKETNWLGPWAHDGRLLAFATNLRDPAGMDAYVLDMASGAVRLVAENNGIGYLTDLSRDGGRAVLYRQVHRSDDNLYLLDLAGGATTLLTPHEGPGSFEQGCFSPDGRTVYLSSNAAGEHTAFARVALDAAGRPGPITVGAARDDAELDSFVLSEDGRTAALLWNVAGRSELAFLDLASGAMTPSPPLPAEVAVDLAFARDGRVVACSVMGAAAPRDVWRLERAANAWQRVSRSPHAGVPLDRLVRPELVRFPAHDGLPLSAWLYRPQDFAAPGACVLSFHGGPEAQERPTFNSTYQALLAAGIAVLAPNVRGSTGFGKTFMNLDNGPLRFDAVQDIATCVDFAVAAGVADPARVGIMGGSYGGYMTMAGLTAFPE
ncbi:MAG: prolyl oligopeptidase family serine peptidase, partial [Candidatus Dormibacteraeota bacterium]|nr:prolyl oligopeptidase family serine peptidase [Candidatus Dormibacteraeota bacterium]